MRLHKKFSPGTLDLPKVSQVRKLTRSDPTLEDDLLMGRFLFCPRVHPAGSLSHDRTRPGTGDHPLLSELRVVLSPGKPPPPALPPTMGCSDKL